MERLVHTICQYLLKNLDHNISLEELEKEFYYNRYHIVRAFKQYTGLTMKEYINTAKVLKTIDPLLLTQDTILKIALNNGFQSQGYYTKTFQGVIGISPLRFRKSFSEIENQDIHALKEKRNYLLYLKQYQESLSSGCMEKEGKVKKLQNSRHES